MMTESEKIFKQLQHIAIFSHCDEETLKSFAGQSHIMTAEKGQVLFVHEEPAKRFFIIMDGWIKLFRETLDGTQAVIDIISHGHMLGETSIFQKDMYPYSAEAIEPCRLISLPLQLLKAEMDSNLPLVKDMLALVAGERTTKDKELEHLIIQNAPQRIGCFLLRLTSQSSSGPVSIQLPYDKSLVAARLGMQAETFSRALGKLKDATGLVIHGSTIELDDVKKLINFSCAACSSKFPCKDLECKH